MHVLSDFQSRQLVGAQIVETSLIKKTLNVFNVSRDTTSKIILAIQSQTKTIPSKHNSVRTAKITEKERRIV